MKLIGINASPRRNKNTAKLIDSAVAGAKSVCDVSATVYNLFDYKFTGCLSCFSCKWKDSKYFGNCVINDELTPIINEAREADIIIIGSPIYYYDVTGAMQNFAERLWFPVNMYDEFNTSLWPKRTAMGQIFDMNIDENRYRSEELAQAPILRFERFSNRFFSPVETILSFDTFQFDNPDRYDETRWDKEHKLEIRKTAFPDDLKKSFDMGVRLVRALL